VRYAEFEIVTMAFMKNNVFLDIAHCNPVKFSRRFGRTYYLPLQDRRIILARNQHERVSKLCEQTSIIENGENIFPRNIY
jgi:hypothetical protein